MSRRGTSPIWRVAVCVLVLAAAAACGGSDGDASAAGAPGGQRTASKSGGGDGSANKRFCEEYGRLMTAMREGEAGPVRDKAERDFQALLKNPPATFEAWAADMIPWIDAIVADAPSEKISAAAGPSEKAAAQVSNKCQFVLADMDG